LAAVLLAWGAMAYWHTHKPLLPGMHVAGNWVAVTPAQLEFIADITAADGYGRPVLSHAIFDEVLGVVRSARRFLVLDYFLFDKPQLRDALIERRRVEPQLQVLLTVDPINEAYGGAPSADLALLRAAGIDVVLTDLDRLRDSNYWYSGLWRLAFGWWSSDGRGDGWLPNPLPNSLDEGSSKLTLRAWAQLMNFKANHRKVIIGDDGEGELVGIVASANPHEASEGHSNVALKAVGPALAPLLASELALARESGWRGEIALPRSPESEGAVTGTRVQYLTEGAIRTQLLARIGAASKGDSIDIAMFYIADRDVVEALLTASQRTVAVRLILDPNKDAFGRVKSGIPNRPVASELVAVSNGAIHVRWYRTHGEQFHSKLVMVYSDESLWLTLGSANLTRRNLDDFNLEANLAAELPRGSQLAVQALDYFDTLWSNRAAPGIEYTADFAVYADPTQTHYWLYRFMEGTGLSTF
jgi:phosphatidylserine/phosphatidylglycerophosphate/cardiolipin synthase-like enzyme